MSSSTCTSPILQRYGVIRPRNTKMGIESVGQPGLLKVSPLLASHGPICRLISRRSSARFAYLPSRSCHKVKCNSPLLYAAYSRPAASFQCQLEPTPREATSFRWTWRSRWTGWPDGNCFLATSSPVTMLSCRNTTLQPGPKRFWRTARVSVLAHPP